MKSFNNLLVIIPIALLSAAPKLDQRPGNPIVYNCARGRQAVLQYIGSVSGASALNIGIRVSIDTTIGIRYEFTAATAIGGQSLSHIAIFYKFSNPYRSIFYNFLTHKSTVINYSGPQDSDPNVDVVGQATLDSFVCTHLQQGGGTKYVSDYWMCPNVPGFSKIVNSLKNISPDLPALAFNGTIFSWGGLVKWTIHDEDDATNIEVHLYSANTNVTLPRGDFEVPSK